MSLTVVFIDRGTLLTDILHYLIKVLSAIGLVFTISQPSKSSISEDDTSINGSDLVNSNSNPFLAICFIVNNIYYLCKAL